MAIELDFYYDEKRQGYWINGGGFDFFAYFTEDEEKNTYIECDSVCREGDDFKTSIQVKLGPSGQVHRDILETAVHNELNKWWPNWDA